MNTWLTDWIKKHPLAAYFLLAYTLTWSGSLLYYFTGADGEIKLPQTFSLPGALVWYYGPCLAALLVTRLTGGSLRALLRRFLDWKLGWRCYAFILLYPLALHVAVVGLDWLLGGPVPHFFQAESVPAGSPWLVLPALALFQFLVRGIGEETGWRGFALPKMLAHRDALTASLALGLLWALWHFHPANFSALFSPGGVYIFINITLTSVVFTWLANQARGSLFAAALFHTMLNLAEYIVPLGMSGASLTRQALHIAWITGAAVSLALVSGKDLGRRSTTRQILEKSR